MWKGWFPHVEFPELLEVEYHGENVWRGRGSNLDTTKGVS
jgi:hypothetical protein